MANNETQVQKVLRIMREAGAISRVTAMHYGIMNLTARITDLRQQGYDVICTWKQDADGNRYGSFSLN